MAARDAVASPPGSPPALSTAADAMLWLAELEASEAGGRSDATTGQGSQAPPSRKKRAVKPPSSASGSADASASSPDEAAPPAAKKAKRKPRKATHTVRKEEKARLLKELAVLHTQMEDLKARALRTYESEEQGAKEKMVANRVLRRAIQSQQIEFARVHGLMSEYFLFDTQAGSPLHRFLHLTRDREARHAMLMGMKSSVIADAERFLRDRFPRLDPCKPMREEHCFEASNGDYCGTFVSITQLEGVRSVKQMFDALQGFFCNIEISISERLGNVTIREDDDRRESGLAQNRLVTSTTPNHLLMESNSIFFSRYDDVRDEDGRSYGIIVCDYVDHDDLHPYHPSKRTRRDVNAILQLTTHVRPIHRVHIESESDEDQEDEQEMEEVIVLTHWVNSRLQLPSFQVSPGGWRELRDNSERWVRALQTALHEINFSRSQPLSDIELL